MKYDQHENCAKCGYPGKTVEYKVDRYADPDHLGRRLEETLRLTCSRCGFLWFRDRLDKEGA